MTVSTTTNRISYTGDGVSVAFTVPFIFLANADISVYVSAVKQTTGFTTTGAGAGTGTVTFVTAPANGALVVLVRTPDLLQSTALPPNGPFPSDSVERMSDKAMLGLQRFIDLLSRSLVLNDGDAAATLTLPLLTDRASKFLAFDSSGLPIAASGATGLPASALGTSLLAGTTAAVDRGLLGSGATGDALFLTATAAAAQQVLGLNNIKLDVSAAGGVLTVALKDRAGNDATAASPIVLGFRSATATDGSPSVLTITGAQSLAVSSGSTLGVPATSTPFRVWFVEFNDAGTPRLGAINCLSITSGPPAIASIYPLRADALASSTAEGGAGAADSAQVFYTGTAVTAKPSLVLGYAEWSAGLATLGTWTAPTKVQMYGAGVPLPGDTIQVQQTQTGTGNTGTTQIPLDDTIPQNTEGDQYMSQAITPTSTANLLTIDALAHLSNNVGVVATIAALFQDATANAIAAGYQTAGGASFVVQVPVRHQMRAGTVAATTFKLRGGVAAAATVTFNGAGGARTMGGALCSYLRAAEVMA